MTDQFVESVTSEEFKLAQKRSSAAARVKGEARIALEKALREIDAEASNVAADFDLIDDPDLIAGLAASKLAGIVSRGDRSRNRIKESLREYSASAIAREIAIRKHDRKAE